VNGTDQLIAEALRDIADQAAPPPRMADTAWRAGRHRQRRSVLAASVAGVAGAAAIAVAIPLTLAGSPHAGGPGPGSAPGPVRLRTPILFEQVASVSRTPCAAGPGQVPGIPPDGCVHLTGTGMTITSLKSARVQRVRAHQYGIYLTLTRADAHLFAALTRNVAGLPSPHNELAIISGGHAVEVPTIQAPFTANGHLQIYGFTSRAQAQKLLRTVPGTDRPAGPAPRLTARAQERVIRTGSSPGSCPGRRPQGPCPPASPSPPR
jgi:hypothetical protein